jgi:CDP-diacylglycerol--glycerol-3-phosphate 3-phosphatidyltransferase
MKYLANIITISRLPLAILVIMYLNSPIRYFFFGLGVLFDGLDGYVARKTKTVSKLGKILDPLFDKIFNLIIYFGIFNQMGLPFYYALMFFSRDIFTVIGASYVFIRKIKVELEARLIGKLVTGLQFVTLIFMLMFNYELTRIGTYLILPIAILSITDYIAHVRHKSNH